MPKRRAQDSFELESQLCDVLAAGLRDALGWSGEATMLSEVQVGSVIPDLVLVDPRRVGSSVGSLTGFETWIVADLLRSRSRRVKTLSRRLFARPEATTRAVARLERVGFLARASEASFSLREDSFPRDAEVVAIEAKLRRWREAIDQATEYLLFANCSYVALPKETIDGSMGILPACRHRGLGVIAVAPAGIHVVRKAPRHQPRSAGWVSLVARALRDDAVTASTRSPARRAMRAGVRAPFAR